MDIKDGVTENGDVAHISTESKVLDLFFGSMVRGVSKSELLRALSLAWNDDPELTMKVVLHGRDVRGGRGERRLSQRAMLWLRSTCPRTYVLNLRRFLALGYYKDLLVIAQDVIARQSRVVDTTAPGTFAELEGLMADLRTDCAVYSVLRQLQDVEGQNPLVGVTTGAPIELELLVTDLQADWSAYSMWKQLDDEKKGAGPVCSLAAKWAPSEGGQFDNLAHVCARLMFPDEARQTPQCHMKAYRKMLSELRGYLKVVERFTTSGRWEEIVFSRVPSRAHQNLRGAFRRHVPIRYGQYLESVRKGESTIKTTGLQPHELVRHYFSGGEEDPTVEAAWTELTRKLAESGSFDRTVAVVDVSGSMSGTPMEVSVALGILVSTLTKGPFNRQCITFSETPSWHSVQGATLREMVVSVRGMHWGGNTNLDRVFQLILDVAESNQLSQEDLPSTLFVFSDMQFDAAFGGSAYCDPDSPAYYDRVTALERARAAFSRAGFQLPKIVFWNLRSSAGSFPCLRDESGVGMLSGFSSELLKSVMAGDADVLTPMHVLHQTVDSYEVQIDPAESGPVPVYQPPATDVVITSPPKRRRRSRRAPRCLKTPHPLVVPYWQPPADSWS